MSAARPSRPAVFLDRDGTLNRELARPPSSAAELELLPGVAAAAAALARAGFVLVCATNQAAIARGGLDFEGLGRVHTALAQRMDGARAPLAGLYACPHHPSEGAPPYRRPCGCRKPAPGLLLRAARELDLDLARSWMVGDAERDLVAAEAVGVRAILVRTGKGARELARMQAEGRRPARCAADLAEAARLILAERGEPQGR